MYLEEKTDMKDAEWIALLGRCGLVNASYVPDKENTGIALFNKAAVFSKARKNEAR